MDFVNLDSREKRALKNSIKRFLPILVVLILIASVLVSYIHFLNKRKTIYEVQQKLIADIALGYNNHISNLTSIVRTIEIEYTKLYSRDHTEKDVQNLFISYLGENPNIDQVRILNLDGMEVIRINKGHPSAYVVPENQLQDKSTRYYYTEAKNLDKNQFLFSALDLNIENNEIEIDPETGLDKPTFRISTPIITGDERIGYFVVNFLMRDYLDSLRDSTNITGGAVLMFDGNGYMYNHPDNNCNFGFCFDEFCEQHNMTVKSIFDNVDLGARSGSFIENNTICSYATFENIIDLSSNYFLSENATSSLYFMVSFDILSPYGEYIDYKPLQSISNSWNSQIIMVIVIFLSYFSIIYMYFLSNRFRFTNAFSDNRYSKRYLKKALHNHEFINYYQPVINIQSGTIMGVEALARWQHNGQILPPEMFMDEIHNYELGIALDEKTFSSIREDKKTLDKVGFDPDSFISINISRQTFEYMIKDNAKTIIKLTESEKDYIVFELLEDIVIHKDSADKIREMDSNRVRFAIDDFGTGNSNIAFIRSFENMKVKIDKAFVPKDVTNKKECVIIEAFVKMFVDQGTKLIVEGVETKTQYLYLKNLNVAGIQGFYFSKPLSIEELCEYVKNKEYLNIL